MALILESELWMLVERLGIHSFKSSGFVDFLQKLGIEYSTKEFDNVGMYPFMSERYFGFAEFAREHIQSFKYPKILEGIIFDDRVIETQTDNWNYYGEHIKNWYPRLIDLVRTSGLKINETLKTIEIDDSVPAPGQVFLEFKFGDRFIDLIVDEINSTHQEGYYLSVMFLSRKLLEAITVRVMEKVFPKIRNGQYDEKMHSLWYDKGRGKHHDFSYLLDRLKENSSIFDEDSGMVEEFVFSIQPFRKECNLCVHHDYKIPDLEYVAKWKIPNLISMSHRLFRKYCNP